MAIDYLFHYCAQCKKLKLSHPWLAALLECVNLYFSKVFQVKFYKINLQVKTCVKVGDNGVYFSRRLFPHVSEAHCGCTSLHKYVIMYINFMCLNSRMYRSAKF